MKRCHVGATGDDPYYSFNDTTVADAVRSIHIEQFGGP